MEREILHIDCNKFYASVECLLHPELKNKPVAVGGNEASRHGIILTKNEIAAKYGIKTGEALFKAKQKCPDLIIVEPNYPIYMEYSKMVRRIFNEYTPLVEPFGIDECWLDVTGDYKLSGKEIGEEIKERIKKEIGITVSVGLSFNKVFAKLGSDYKKPDAMTIITKDSFRDIVWPLPCGDMIMVGKATQKKLSYYGIKTLGELANANENFLKGILGKNGLMLRSYARGEDFSPVNRYDAQSPIKSIGNSCTLPRDIYTPDEAKIVFSVLADSVAVRMRRLGLRGSVLTIGVKDNTFSHFTRQCALPSAINIGYEFTKVALKLLNDNYDWNKPIRSLGISVSAFEHGEAVQLDFERCDEKRIKRERLERTMDKIRERYGNGCIVLAVQMLDKSLCCINPFEHIREEAKFAV